jgi:hypothetical protein
MKLRTPVAMRAVVLSSLFAAVFSAGAQCPALGNDTTCGTIITITPTMGAIITKTGQGTYDGSDDTLVGVVNNSNVPISSLVLSSGANIFGFDGDGVTTFGAPGNARDSTGYGGPNTYFTNINASQTTGTVNFITPLAPKGGTTYFGLENDLVSTAPCSDIIKNGVSKPVVSGAKISATFTPNFGFSLPQAAVLCGFVDFDWVQTLAHQTDPNPFSALNLAVVATTGVVNGTTIPIRLGGAFDAKTAGTAVKLTAAKTPYNDPPQGGGYTYNSASPDYSYPFYCNVLGDSACTKTNASISMTDTPSNACFVDSMGNAGAAYTGSPAIQALCGNKLDPIGGYTGFTTHLAGVKADGTAKDLGLGFAWKSNFNGTAGGANTNKTTATVDPGSGTGGVTLVSVTEDTNYQFSGFGVTSINGSSSTQTLLRGDQVSVTASGLAYSRVTQTFSGFVTLTNLTDNPISGPFQLVFTFLDSSVTLTNATGTFGGFPFLTVTNDLPPGQPVTVSVRFSNPANTEINFSPIVYEGSFN